MNPEAAVGDARRAAAAVGRTGGIASEEAGMTVKCVSTETPGDYLVVDLADGRVLALDPATVRGAFGSRRPAAGAVPPDPHVFVDRSLPGRRERPGVDAIVVSSLRPADGSGFVARLEGEAGVVVLSAGEVAALIDALERR